MNTNELRREVIDSLHEIAPEADLSFVDEDVDLRDALDLDSMDILRFARLLLVRTGVEIPEADYRHITSIAGCRAYLETHLPRS